MLFLKCCLFACPGGEGRPPVAPLLPPPAPHLVLPLALLPIPGEPDEEEGVGMGVVLGAGRGQDDVLDLTPEAEGVMEELDPGGGVTGHDRDPTTETESERGTETETGGGTWHAGDRGVTLHF